MANAAFSWINNLKTATLSSLSAAVVGLGPTQLQNDQGSTSMAWRTLGTTATLFADTGSPSSVWRALCLARTNLTSAATLKWTFGPLDALNNPVRGTGAYHPGSNTTSAGTYPNENGVAGLAQAFTNSSPAAGNQYMSADGCPVTAGTTYRFDFWLRRASGGTIAGSMFAHQWTNPDGSLYSLTYDVPMTSMPQGVGWNLYSLTLTAPITGKFVPFFCINTGDGTGPFTYVIGDNLLYAVATYTSPTYTGVVPGFGQLAAILPSDQVAQACRVDISDPANPDGFISIAQAHAGPIWQPQTNIAFSSTFGRDDQVDEATARSGAEYPVFRYARRRWSITLAGVRASEVWPDAMELDRIGRMGSNVLFIPDPASSNIQRETVLGRFTPTSDLEWTYQAADRRQYSAKITERL